MTRCRRHEPITHRIVEVIQGEHGGPWNAEVRPLADKIEAALRDDRAAGMPDPTDDEIDALVSGVENEAGADVPPEIAAKHPHLDAVLTEELT